MTPTSTSRLTPLPLKQVTLAEGFWSRPLDINRTLTIPHQYRMCKETGRIDAFRLQWQPGQDNPPHQFWDSDVGKWLEAAAYSLASHPDPALEQCVDTVVDLIAGAQQPDGYLNSHFTVVEPENRWTNLRDMHELYCAGHLMEGAVAHFEATGKRTFLAVMCRYADYIATIFGREPGQKRGYPGHEEIELALVKLYRVTGEKRYLDLARFFIDERGRQPHYYDQEAQARGEDPGAAWFGDYSYNQAHVPVREQVEPVGHAVRAMYLYCGMADLAAEDGNPTLSAACENLWQRLVETRMHVTGGVGPTHANEGFTQDYDLPNEGAYLETCAAIGLVFWAHRMLAVELDARYADVMERALYNGVLSGMSLDGKTFFYGNPLAASPGFDGNGQFVRRPRKRQEDGLLPEAGVEDTFHYRRSEWFGCACCPPNLARLLASLGQYVYATAPGALGVHLYVGGAATVELAGTQVGIKQETDYPWSGDVRLTLSPAQAAEFDLKLRIPGWCSQHTIRVNGQPVAAPIAKGYAHLRRTWQEGDTVELTLNMPVERIAAHPRARQNVGKVALHRGPLVYCLEECDNPQVSAMMVPPDAAISIRHEPELLGGIVVLEGEARRVDEANWSGRLYAPAEQQEIRPVPFRAIPYFAWANREPGGMVVWIPQAPLRPRER